MKPKPQTPLLCLSALTMLVVLTLSGCAVNKPTYNTPTIVFNKQGVPSHYQVKTGDTLSTIAQSYGLNYRKVGSKNNLNNEYRIYAGQWLKLWNSSSHSSIHNPDTKNTRQKNNKQLPTDYNSYHYPTKNSIRRSFSTDSDGIWFYGQKGDPVYAVQGGTIIYSGEGLSDFGKLVMIRHADNLITAYAHNSKILVPEGSFVSRGQKIANMGRTGKTKKVGLQLQVRRNGTPINPLEILGSR